MSALPQPVSARPLAGDFRQTLRLALPLIFAELGWMSMGIVDTIMVGRLPNSAIAIGATGLGQSLYHMLAIFGGGLLLGMDTFVSQAHGRNDIRDARHTLVNGLVLALVLTPLLMIAVSFWPFLMRSFGISVDLVGPMRPFLYALNWGTLPLLTYFALRRYLQARDVALPITFALISANIVNLFGDWVLIYGHLGFRPHGIVGSGWSTCFARIYMAAVLAITFLWTEKRDATNNVGAPPSPNGEGGFGGARIDLARIQALLKLGLPASAQILLEIGAFAGAAALCAKLGPVQLSGHEIALNYAGFAFMVPLGISSAAAVRVGQNLGRQDPAGARRAGWSAILLGSGFMTCCALIFLGIPTQLARVFSPDPNVVRFGAMLLRVAAAFELFDGLQVVTTGALRGAGDTRTPMIANFVAYWLIGLPLGYILAFPLGWGSVGIWIGLCIGLMLIGSVLLLVWHRKHLAAYSHQ